MNARITSGPRFVLAALFLAGVVLLAGAQQAFAAEISVSDEASFRDAIANAADGDTITVTADFTATTGVEIPTGKTLTIDLGSHTITAQGLPAESSLLAGKDATLTVQNGSFTSEDGTARAALLEGSNSTFTDVSFTGFGGVYMGGAICARYVSSTIGETTSLTLEGCTFDNNTANIGGAVAVLGVDNVNVKNCTFTNNSADASVAIPSGPDSLSSSRGDGGALAHLAEYESNNSGGYQFTLEGNSFDSNKAENRGGAIHFKDPYPITTNLVSGTFTNNSADWGGAIDYTMHHQPPLKLTNVLITENDAVRGGGLWVCPQGTLSIGYNLGGSIFGNTATGQTMGEQGTMLSAAGDDICNEGVDSIDISPQLDGGSGAPVTVVPGGIGGVQTQWFSDAAGNRYQEGAGEADPNVYTNASNSFALHGEVSSDGAAIARSEAKVIFTNNHAKSRGGAIATNSPIEIGIEEDTASVALSKHYADLANLADAPEVSGIVYRVDAQGNRVAIMDDVRLNAGNNWERVIEHLPTVYVDDQGQVQHYSYAVGEQPLEGFELESANLVRSNVVIATVSLPEKP